VIGKRCVGMHIPSFVRLIRATIQMLSVEIILKITLKSYERFEVQNNYIYRHRNNLVSAIKLYLIEVY